ncbi:hypothetical protein ACOMHN_004934 [Nucella lapillus]
MGWLEKRLLSTSPWQIDTERVPHVITHNPSNPPLARWLKSHLTVLHSSRRMKQAAPSPPVVGERNGTTLRRLLMPSKALSPQQASVEQTDTTQKGCFKCAARKCILCHNYLQVTSSFSSTRTQQH